MWSQYRLMVRSWFVFCLLGMVAIVFLMPANLATATPLWQTGEGDERHFTGGKPPTDITWALALEEALLAEEWDTVRTLLAETNTPFLAATDPALVDQIAGILPTEKPISAFTPNLQNPNPVGGENSAMQTAIAQAADAEAKERVADPAQPNHAAAILTVGSGCTYANLPAALSVANDGDIIRVEGTTWVGDIASIGVHDSVTIIGGYNSTCNTITGVTTLDGTGGLANSVVEFSAGVTVEMENFVITGGEDDGFIGGGGLDLFQSNVTLRNVTVQGNHSSYGGGIFVFDNSTLTLDNFSRVYSNTVSEDGGGIFCQDAGTVILQGGSDIGYLTYGNTAIVDDGPGMENQGEGGGIYLDDCDLTLNAQSGSVVEVKNNQAVSGGGIYAINNSHVYVQGNQAKIHFNGVTDYGGGMLLINNSSAYVDSAKITDNFAGTFGGGVFVNNSLLDIDNGISCTAVRCAEVSRNTSWGGGAFFATGNVANIDLEAVYVEENEGTFRGSVIYAYGDGMAGPLFQFDSVMMTDNNGGADISETEGSIIYLRDDATLNINSSTIAGNSDNDNTMIDVGTGNMTASGLIVWGNDGTSMVSGTATINCSVLQQFHAGTENEVADPMFVDAANGDYHILPNSPAIDQCDSGFGSDIDQELRPNASPSSLSVLKGDEKMPAFSAETDQTRALPTSFAPGNYDAGADEAYAFVGINGAVCEYGSIVSAITAATAGDTIYIPNGYYEEVLGDINKNLTFKTATNDCTTATNVAPGFVTIDANAATRTYGGVARIMSSSTVTVTNILLADGAATYGGGVYVDFGSKLILKDSILRYNTATLFGGGIRNSGQVEMFYDSIVEVNTTTGSGVGGGIATTGLGVVDMYHTSRIIDNSSANEGGGVYMLGTLNLHDDSRISNNSATTNGGGVYAASGGDVLMEHDSIIGHATALATGNSADIGAGLYLTGVGTTLLMRHSSQVKYNTADFYGGGIAAYESAEITIDGANVRFNLADVAYGGGVYIPNSGGNNVHLTVTNGGGVDNNTATWAGGLALFGANNTAIFTGTATLDNNIANFAGGAMVSLSAELKLDGGAIVQNNDAIVTSGGGLYVAGGTLRVNNALIQDNTAVTNGGGIYQTGGHVILYDGTRLLRNEADDNGGGYYKSGGVDLDVGGDVVISQNEAANNGGGIYQTGGAGQIFDFNNYRVTIQENRAINGNGGGLYLQNVVDSTFEFLAGTDVISNTATNGLGGGVYADDVDIDIINVHFHNNQADTGGGLAMTNTSLVDITDDTLTASLQPGRSQLFANCDPQSLPANTYCSEFRENQAVDGTGGAIYVAGNSVLDVDEVAFMGNSSTAWGGAIFSLSSGDVVLLDNALFHDNSSSGIGSPTLHMFGSGVLTLNNNTFANNNGRAIWAYNSGIVFTLNNNLVWGNGDGIASAAAIGGNGCNISQNGVGGAMVDPKFATTGRGDYRLGVNSGAVDECTAGTGNDLDNVARPKNGNGVVDPGEFDIGAFECTGDTAVAQTMTATQMGADVVIGWAGGSLDDAYYIYRDTSPYFYPTTGNLIASVAGTSYTDVGVVGNAGINYYYHFLSATCAGTTPATNNVAEFDFAIVPGTP